MSVLHEMGKLGKCFATFVTDAWFLTGVNAFVHRKIAALVKRFVTFVTFVRFITGVNTFMSVKTTRDTECSAT